MIRTFQQVLTKVEERTKEMNPVDRWSSLNRFEFVPLDKGKFYLKPIKLEGENLDKIDFVIPDMQLSPHALDQLITRVDYSTKLLTRLPLKCLWTDVNWLIQHMDERDALIRTVYGDTIRAILGSRYTPLDDIELFTLIAPYVKGAIVRWESIGDLSSHISISFPEDVDSKGLQRGIQISNSEVGLRSVIIQAIMYRESCANILPASGGDDDVYIRKSPFKGNKALVANSVSGWRFIHTGDKDRLQHFVKDAIEDSKRQYEVLLARYNAGLEKQIDAIGAIEELSKKENLSKDQLKRILDAYAQEYNPTVTGVAMAFTRAAQKEEESEDRFHMQSIGTLALKTYLN